MLYEDHCPRFLANLLFTALMKSKVLRYEDLGTLLVPATQIAKSLVISPCSTASMVEASRVWQNFSSSGRLSSLALWRRPLVQAKMEAIELVEVSLPFWCSL